MGVILAIECSQRQGGVSVRGRDGIVRTALLESASGVDDQLLPEIDRLLCASGDCPADISLVGASIGPGGFTGLRITIATVKMLAKACQCDVVGVPTASIAAVQWRGTHPGDAPVAVALATKRGETWLTVVDGSGHHIEQGQQVDAPTAQRVLGACGVHVLLADETLPEAFQAVAQSIGATIEPLWCTSEACLALTEQAHAAGQLSDVESLIPLYPRAPEAVRVFQPPSR
ncbi:MAG TPA: tRNA (adenosine(37)-N6)-threonylcarbamoyltransferase complex dimerization subunit type 1 TsaB [Phycisphaerales bacterium]|nr:tRNA (adenosine(37)-N6)-threonylcarbamoyltransferase complex dimerization subunit type 1 TsaB [Phycisphaerales bacterium]